MSKYIIDTGDYLFTTDGVLVVGFDCDNKPATFYNSLDNLEELNSDYINEHFGELQDEAYQAGLNDAWEAARKIVTDTDHGGLASRTLCEIFDTRSYSYIMRENTAQEAVDKIKAYDDSKHSDRIEVGDEVIDNDGDTTIVTNIHERLFDGLCSDGSTMSDLFLEDVRKTGRHYDHIGKLLEEIRA